MKATSYETKRLILQTKISRHIKYTAQPYCCQIQTAAAGMKLGVDSRYVTT